MLYKPESLSISGNLLNLFRGFLNDRHQRVVFNGLLSDWAPILAGVPQSSILGPLLFLIYINDLFDKLNSFIKLFADDTSLFSSVYDPNNSPKVLNDALNKISEWTYKWKMLFNPDLTKQTQEIIFSKKKKNKKNKTDRRIVYYNEAPVAHTTCPKHLGMHLDEKLNFSHHINQKIAKANKSIGLIRKLAHVLPRQSLITIYKSFIQPHLDYGDMIYDQPNNESFCNFTESSI